MHERVPAMKHVARARHMTQSGSLATQAMAMVCVIAATLGAPRALGAGNFSVADLMQGLAQRGPESARFVERKFIAILDQPVESSGELRYVPPDRLEKRTLKPRPEMLVLERDTLTLERDKRRMTLRLQDYPQIAALVESLRGMLGGNRAALEKVYRLHVYGDREQWALVMLPSDAKLAELVLRIDVAGTRDRVRTIEIRQADGDRSVMTIDN